ncbi:ZirU family protein [Pseudomonas sp. CP4]|uniref:ZirU family protein n=1 Tax=Pseudomonas sp. CP4 TaxID=3388844 RepID=UPI0039EF60E5
MKEKNQLRRSRVARDQVNAANSEFAKRKRNFLTASVILAIYGCEALAMPLAAAATRIESSQQVTDVAAENSYLLYSPQQGETLAKVAQRFNVEESAMAASRAQVAGYGWLGRVWLVPKQATGEAALYPGYVLYTLKKGERLDSLALRVNRSVRELVRLNAQVMGDAAAAGLKAGDAVVLPAQQAKDFKAVDELAERESRAFEQRLAQGVSQVAQSYTASQDSGSGVSASNLLTEQAASSASSALSQGVEEFLSPHGRAKVNVRINADTKNTDIEFDYLHPLLEGNEDIIFGQVGARTFDERHIANVGLGYRKQVSPDLILGANAFVDQDFSNNHTRGGAGIEAWTEKARLAANAYAPLSGWKKSGRDHLNTNPERFDLLERAASGWDVRAEVALPGAPKLAGTAKYFQWNGEGVDAFGGGQLEKDPKGYSIGAKWQPIPLVGFTAEHQKIHGGDGQWQVGASFTWTFDRELQSQLNPDNATALKPLSEARKDFVQREYNVVLDYKQKEKKVDPLEFVVNTLTLFAPASGASAVRQPSPALKGVRSSMPITYVQGGIDFSGGAASRSTQLDTTVDPVTGHVDIPPGISPRSVHIIAQEMDKGEIVREAAYTLILNAPIVEPEATPIVDVTDIKGVLQVGQTLTGEYTFDANGGNTTDASTMQWKNGGHADTDASYLLDASDVGLVLEFEVTAKNGADVVGNTDSIDTSTAPSIIIPIGNPIVDVTDIKGVLQVGQTLTGEYTFDANGGNTTDASTMQWKNGGHADTDASYLLDASDVGLVLEFEVTAKNGADVVGNTDSIDTSTAPSIIIPIGNPIVDVTDIKGVLQVGQTLTGEYTFDANGGNTTDASTMQWKNGGHADTDASYLLDASDVGLVLEFEVTAKNGAGVVGNTDSIDTATAPSIIKPIGHPIVDVTDIKGVLHVGQTLTGEYSFDANGGNTTDASTMQWKNGGHADTDASYQLDASDVGLVLEFEVTAKNGAGVVGNTDSIDTATAAGSSGGGIAPPGSVIDPVGAVVITGADGNGNPIVGTPLTATPTCVSTCGTVNYQWQIEDAIGSGNFVDISGETSSTYRPTKNDQRRIIKVKASN